jgi:DNA end-binding protein Ku
MARALWKGAISFGLVTIPVSLYPARDAQSGISFHLLHKDDFSRVHQKWVDEQDHEVPYDDLVRGYEYEKDRYVVIGDGDLAAANVEATQTIDIMHFVDATAIDLAYFDTPYYTEPGKAGRKAYALLRETLRQTRTVGVAKLVIRSKQHLCAVIPDGPALIAFTLRWPYQLRDASEFNLPGEVEVSEQELNMARQLVEAMTTEWRPEQYRDTFHDDLLALIDDKVRSGRLTEPAAEAPKKEQPQAQVIDIMSLLKRSMEAQRAAVEGSGQSDETGASAGRAHVGDAR